MLYITHHILHNISRACCTPCNTSRAALGRFGPTLQVPWARAGLRQEAPQPPGISASYHGQILAMLWSDSSSSMVRPLAMSDGGGLLPQPQISNSLPLSLPPSLLPPSLLLSLSLSLSLSPSLSLSLSLPPSFTSSLPSSHSLPTRSRTPPPSPIHRHPARPTFPAPFGNPLRRFAFPAEHPRPPPAPCTARAGGPRFLSAPQNRASRAPGRVRRDTGPRPRPVAESRLGRAGDVRIRACSLTRRSLMGPAPDPAWARLQPSGSACGIARGRRAGRPGPLSFAGPQQQQSESESDPPARLPPGPARGRTHSRRLRAGRSRGVAAAAAAAGAGAGASAAHLLVGTRPGIPRSG